MNYAVEFTDLANDDLASLDSAIEDSVRRKIAELAESADVRRHRALTGPLRGFYRLRVGDYRVQYVLSHRERKIAIHRVQHRSDAYRQR